MEKSIMYSSTDTNFCGGIKMIKNKKRIVSTIMEMLEIRPVFTTDEIIL